MDKSELIAVNIQAIKIFDANNTCMTVKECANFLNVAKKTVTRHIHAGKIEAIFIGRIWRIPKLQFVDEILSNEYN